MDFSKKKADNIPPGEQIENLAREVLRDRYSLVRKLYEEEFETVYLAEPQNEFVTTNCLIQQFSPQYISSAQLTAAKNLFNQEAAILKNLGSHPQIPSVYDYFETQGQFFIVQEFILGQSLQEELSEAQPYSESETIEFLNNILPVLQFIHNSNFIHRDIKPSHLMRNVINRNICLINFYSVKEKINPQNLDITGQFAPHLTVGTQGYIPMEQHLGKPEFCSDIYALGIVVIQALTKIKLAQLQYDDENNPVWRHLLPNRTHFNGKFLDIIDTMVRCNHRKRYQSAIAILASLKQLSYPNKFTKNSFVPENPESKSYVNERILTRQNQENIAQSPEQTIVQPTPKPASKNSESTVILDNSESQVKSPEHTLIVDNLEPQAKSPEHTFILQDNNLESTRIIDYQIDRNHNNNSQNNNKSKFNILLATIGVILITIAVIVVFSIVKNNQNSTPKNSLFMPHLTMSTIS